MEKTENSIKFLLAKNAIMLVIFGALDCRDIKAEDVPRLLQDIANDYENEIKKSNNK